MPADRGTDRSRLQVWLVLIILIAFAVGGFFVTRNTAQREEQQLLEERAAEVAALLSTSDTLAASLQLIGEVYVNGEGTGRAFAAAARTLLTGTVTHVGIAQLTDGEAIVVDVEGIEGTTLASGDVLGAQHDELVRRAIEAQGLVSTLMRGDEFSTLIMALGRSDGLVVFEEALFASEPTPAEAASPFEELDAVLYRTPTADLDNMLIATTDDLPLPGPVAERTLTFGSETWLLQAAANTPLASAQARAVPWIILASGLVAAVLAGGVLTLLARRRAYALSLVEQRTVELRNTMTALEAARVAADKANEAKNHFLSRMSHELRTPLNSVLGFAQLLELNEQDPESRDSISHILKGGNHLLNLINEVLDISRIETGDIMLSQESVLASEVITESVDLIRPLAAARSIALGPDHRQTCGQHVFADRQRLKQVLLNLLSNAVKYNRVGGMVSVTCEQSSSTRLRIKVTDTGPGISQEDKELLFVPFERLGADLTDVEGSGIGLALSRRLAEAMGGTLDLESEVGGGTTFWVELPLVEGVVERYERLSVSGSTGGEPVPERVRHKVLYIEDNLANVTLVERIFDQEGQIELVPAMQGRLGLELARQHLPAVILLDLHLADMSGDEVLQLLRDDPETSMIPVVIISADATPGQIQRLKAAGATSYLTKPLDVRELRQAVTEILGTAAASV